MSMNRREFVRAGALVSAGVAATTAVVFKDRFGTSTADPQGDKTIRHLPVLNNIKAQQNEDVLLRMQRELVKAMAKPMEQRRWIMVIDTRKCVGCHACTVGCVAENKLPPGVVYRPVTTEEFGEYPNVQLRFTPRPCMQCDNPPCVPVCPVKATWKRADGIVAVDYDKCIGWPLGNGQTKAMIGKVVLTQTIRPGVVSFALGFGHWATGASDVTIDGHVIKGEPRRAAGIHANAAMWTDPAVPNTCMFDSVGGSVSFYDTHVKLEAVT